MSLPLGEPVIINTDRTGGPGVHWVVLVRLMRNGRHRELRYLYDPLGPKNERVCSEGERVRIKYDHIFPYSSQLKTTGHCGWFSIFIARRIRELLARGHATASDIDEMIIRCFGKSADWGDVRLLQREFAQK